MADLFLPPMAPITPEPTAAVEVVSASATHRGMHFFAAQREITLQTPAPLRHTADQDTEDPTLTWVRSLPSPFCPYDGFGEVSSFSKEYDVDSNELKQDSNTDEESNARDTPTDCYLQDNAATDSRDKTSASYRAIRYSDNCEESHCTNVDQKHNKDSVNLVKTTVDKQQTTPSDVIDLTENDDEKENDTQERSKSEENRTVFHHTPPPPRVPKRHIEACSPVLSAPKRQILDGPDNDVIEVGEAFSPHERSSSVASYCSTSSEILLSPSNPLPNHRMMRDIVRRYLKRPDEMKIIILHAKVVQKSYGSEKRFFCPPPCIRLVGSGWRTKQRRKNASASASSPMPSPGNLGSPSPGSGPVTRASEVYAFIGLGGSTDEMQQLHLETTKDYAAARNLHTPDSDKRKHFQLHIKMFYGDGSEIGRFLSQRIKVISKPSKKKQSVKNPELCIASGTKVSFFNRLRSQTVSTRYLFATRKGFSASSSQWGAFSIYLAREDEDDKNTFDTYDGYIHYGNPVKLVCSVTGMALPRIVIRKVDKHDAIIDTDEPISQLHRCAMFLHNTKRQYLCLSQDKVIAHTATPNSRNGNMDRLNDGSCWTIISTEKTEYCWCDSSLHLTNNIGVTPVPVVQSLHINGGGELAMVELIGENFTPNLSIWFGIVEANTMYRCEECLICVVPEISKIKPDWRYVKEPIRVPLVLTREDGLLYPTHIDFYYMPEQGPKSAPHPTVREILKSKKFVNNL